MRSRLVLGLVGLLLVALVDPASLPMELAGSGQHATDPPGARTGELAGIGFAQRPTGPLELDLFRPIDASGPPPVVMLVHGGGWRSGRRQAWTATARELVAHGFAAATVDYRLSGTASFPAPLDDVRAAIEHLRFHGPALGVDGQRIVVMGGSAGGHLALLAATTGPHVAGVVALSPATDLVALATVEQEHEVPLCASDGTRCRQIGLASLVEGLVDCHPAADACRSALQAASPVTHASVDDPPALLVHARAEVIPLDQAEQMVQALRGAGARAHLVTVEGRGHASQLRVEAWPAIVGFLAQVTGGG